MNKVIKHTISLLLLIVMSHNVIAQTNEMDSASTAASMDLIRIQNAMEAYDSTEFDMEAIASENGFSDTLNAVYAMQGEFFKAVFDSVVNIQNQYVNLEVHEDGKMLIVSKPLPFSKKFLQGNIEEGLFSQMNVDSINITSSGGNKTLHFNFLPTSEYDTYTITYNPSSYRVSETYIKIKTTDETGAFVPGVFSTLRIRFSNFQPISGSISFDTGQYIYPTGGNQFEKQLAYNDYELINLFENQ
ncbi:MAG: hypothetical protein QM687_14430 [Ferruginibacter sp.]